MQVFIYYVFWFLTYILDIFSIYNFQQFNIGKSISERPEEVKTKEIFGHWELDSVVSARGESKACFATFVELKTRFYVAIKMPDRSKKFDVGSNKAANIKYSEKSI